jgi:hypothetical protein
MADNRPPEQKQDGKYRKNEFVLAMSIFVTMSVIGTAFGLWMVGAYNAKPASTPATVEGNGQVSQVPPVQSARPDGVRPDGTRSTNVDDAVPNGNQ